jgi:hypothetical protein
MSSTLSAAGETASPRFLRAHHYVLVLLVCTLSVTTLLKVGEIQYLELILAADLVLLTGLFLHNHLRARVFGPIFSIGQSYTIFLVLAFLLSLLALRQNFNLANETLLKRPLLVTISRMAELFLDAFYMLYLAGLFREDERLRIFAARVYYWTGIAGGIYALATYPLNYFLAMQLGTYSSSHRLRGFDNEGGPYGTYLLSVCALAIAMYHRGWLSRRQFYWGIALLVACLAGSQSKAAFFALAVLGLFYLLMALKGWRGWALIAAMGAVFAVLGLLLNIPGKIEVYNRAIASYQELSNLRSEDGNIVMGRVAGAVLAPRMIAVHPLAGIGWGNYPLVRDNPEYRQGSAFSTGPTDAPGLGLIDYIVDLGFPLCLYLIWVLFKPAYLLRRHRATPGLVTMAAVHPVVTVAGAHLNLIYPWVVVALALGMGFARRTEAVPEHEAMTAYVA